MKILIDHKLKGLMIYFFFTRNQWKKKTILELENSVNMDVSIIKTVCK